MMADADARAVTFGLDSALRLPFWAAAKTGTSKAMRDNWCIGFSDRFTVAVWIGNAEGDSMTRGFGHQRRGAGLARGDAGAAPGPPGRRPPPPAGIETRQIAFADGIEPPRRRIFPAPAPPRPASPPRRPPPAARASSIRSRARVYALDPDIPIARAANPADRRRRGRGRAAAARRQGSRPRRSRARWSCPAPASTASLWSMRRERSWTGACSRCGEIAPVFVIARSVATKRSSNGAWSDGSTGLLRCARNDGIGHERPAPNPSFEPPRGCGIARCRTGRRCGCGSCRVRCKADRRCWG